MSKMKTKWLALFLVVILAIQVPTAVSAAEVSEKNQTVVTQDVTSTDSDGVMVKADNRKYAIVNEITFQTEMKIHLGGGDRPSWRYYIDNMPANGKVTNLSISNKKIATVKSDPKGIHITPKKVGKATIKFTVKYGSKKKDFTSKLTVYKYENPASSYKLDGKQIKSKFNKSVFYNYKLKKNKTVKFDVKAKKGWKISSFRYYDKTGNSKRYTTNSPKIQLKAGVGSVQINFWNEKEGLVENLVVWII